VPGEVVGWFIAGYCPARFLFEFARWRPAHSLYRGLSEAQWTCIGLVASLVMLERFAVLPTSSWHWLVAIFLALVAIIVLVATEVKRFREQVNNRAHRVDIPPCSGM
jgi:prolipoprotein diacylglyceryltransferase